MCEYSFNQLVDLEQLRELLRAHSRVTGICSGILDPEHNILLAEGWQDICTDFHRVHPETCARCLESNRQITQGLGDQNNGIREIRCRNEIVFATCPDF